MSTPSEQIPKAIENLLKQNIKKIRVARPK
jgi:hypothetical protein